MKLFAQIASTKLTLMGMMLLAIGAMLSYGGRFGASIWVLVVPLSILAVNLIAAVATNRRINRQPGLLIFHLGLLTLVLLAAIGRLTHFDAQLEIPVGMEFNPSYLKEIKQGPLHFGYLDELGFVQGDLQVNYAPGLSRGATHSHIYLKDKDGELKHHVVGDDVPLLVGGYRFYTSFNKGFTVWLTWTPEDGDPIVGYVNMPSYPLNDYRQKNEWIPPGWEAPLKLWLKLTTAMDKEKSWVLEQKTSSGVLAVTLEDQRFELNPGDTVKLANAELRYDGITLWMGYTIFYDPTLQWLFYVSVAAVLGLGWYLWRKAASMPLPAAMEQNNETE